MSQSVVTVLLFSIFLSATLKTLSNAFSYPLSSSLSSALHDEIDYDAEAEASRTRSVVSSSSSSSSPFIGSRYSVRLNLGLEPGSSMSQHYPEWGQSGGRLGIPLELDFTNNIIRAKNNDDDGYFEEEAVAAIPENVTAFYTRSSSSSSSSSSKTTTNNNDPNNLPVVFRRIEVASKTTDNTFTSHRGQEYVSFVGGGYSMERSWMMMTTDSTTKTKTQSGRSTIGTSSSRSSSSSSRKIPKPRFLLRFWIDCLSGAKRNDVELQPYTRLIGTIPVWDDPNDHMRFLKQELMNTKRMITEEEEEEEAHKQKRTTTTTTGTTSTSNNNNKYNSNGEQKLNSILGNTISAFLRRYSMNGRKKFKYYNTIDDEESLDYRKEQLERLLPIEGSLTAENGVTIAPKGSLVIPNYNNNNNDVSIDDNKKGRGVREKQYNYIIVGSFSMKYCNQ